MWKGIMAYGKSGEFRILFFLINIQNHVKILQIGIYLVLWMIPVPLYDTMFDTVDLYIYDVWSTERTISHGLF